MSQGDILLWGGGGGGGQNHCDTKITLTFSLPTYFKYQLANLCFFDN